MKILNKIILLFIIISCANNIYSQKNRFIYEYKFSLDSSKKEFLQKSIYLLDIDKDKSVFYNEKEILNDSILTDANEFSIVHSDKIMKTHTEYSVNQMTRLFKDNYLVNDDRVQKWKILNDKNKILNYNVQKAELNYMGRKWTAWFTTEIPIQDGPYKFHGLPGLIMKIEDFEKTHVFELIGVENDFYIRNFETKGFIKINYLKYKKLYKEYRQNPAKKLMGVEISNTQDGISSDEFKRKMSEYYKRQVSQDNNILDLDLLKN
ncbi:GLPGLI family protein [Chryseobacterium wangxinyae]|uniref:GLPGLI family protein n=1 Tax=Chryseobacterium sp. CY353 TaxID=2997334 RepID=UPI00226D5357|nr:GLPGLI family protein [Chryseobacterium sp. CY353]MCY0971136.1 GLPGLI family protein [Chryseobacterium sp. CY353]